MSKPSVIIVYTGHMFEANAEHEAALAKQVSGTLDELGVTEAFGPLACGGDIMVAEAMLAGGGAVHAVLPFAEDDFIAHSVMCGGEEWLPRYRRCRERAASLHFATPGAYVNDDHQFAYGTQIAMGLAALRARQIGGEAVQIAIFDKTARSFSKTGLAGTNADSKAWSKLGKRTIVIDPGPVGRTLKFPPPLPPIYDAQRYIRSILFADYKGFSALGERELPHFMREVMGRIGQTLDDFGSHVEFRNTWGDALYAIIDEPAVAARIALLLQDRLSNLPEGLNPGSTAGGMRIGLHFGPIYKSLDRVTGGPLWYGGEVNRTARIEPVTPVGGVYCTETFAAALVLEGDEACTLTSVGAKLLAKDFGTIELYRLDAAATSPRNTDR